MLLGLLAMMRLLREDSTLPLQLFHSCSSFKQTRRFGAWPWEVLLRDKISEAKAFGDEATDLQTQRVVGICLRWIGGRTPHWPVDAARSLSESHSEGQLSSDPHQRSQPLGLQLLCGESPPPVESVLHVLCQAQRGSHLPLCAPESS